MRVAVPNVSLSTWHRWVSEHGGSPLTLSSSEALPPGLRGLCEPEGFTFSPLAAKDNVIDTALGGAEVRVHAELTSHHFDGDNGVVQFAFDQATGLARHDKLFFPDRAQGYGLGRLTVQRAALLYAAIGVREVSIRAEQVGKYAWATLGFTFASADTAAEVHRAVAEFAADLGVFDAEIPAFTHPWELSTFFADDHGVEVTVEAERIQEVLNARYGQLLVPQIEVDLPASQALLLYADYEGWDGILRLDDPDDQALELLWRDMS
jgi:hypothetical protein